MSTFAELAAVCLISGFVVMGVAWAVFWAVGIFSTPASVQRLFTGRSQEQPVVRYTPGTPIAAVATTFPKMNLADVDIIIVRYTTSTGSRAKVMGTPNDKAYAHATS